MVPQHLERYTQMCVRDLFTYVHMHQPNFAERFVTLHLVNLSTPAHIRFVNL